LTFKIIAKSLSQGKRDFELRLPSPDGRRVGDEGFRKIIFAESKGDSTSAAL
jgi:hypothetical protein